MRQRRLPPPIPPEGYVSVSAQVSRRKQSDEVLEQLRSVIESGEVGPGDSLPSERELMERFGTGRPAVREALQQLQTMGLITIAHGERSRVNRLTPNAVLGQIDAVAQLLLLAEPQQLGHLKDARRMFEAGMVHSAAGRATAQDIADLRAILDTQSGQLEDACQFIRTDILFHNRIAEITGNPLYSAISQTMLRWIFRYHQGLLLWSGQEQQTLEEHRQIIDCIAAKDTAGAVAAVEAHIDRSNRIYIETP